MSNTLQVPTAAQGAPAPRAAGGPARKSFITRSRPWLLLGPALAVLAVLLLWPLVRVLLFSLQDYGLREIVSGEPNWIGLANFGEICITLGFILTCAHFARLKSGAPRSAPASAMRQAA